MTAHTVYVFRDSEGHVLYVGCTGNLPQRLEFHGHSKVWWPEVATVEVEHLPSRGVALEREAELIEELNPPYGGRRRECCRRRCRSAAVAYYYDSTGRCLQVCDGHPVDGARPILPPHREGLPDGDPRHGTTNGYDNHSCRCDECREAVAAKTRAYRASKSAPVPVLDEAVGA